jgi:hypothetical protein
MLNVLLTLAFLHHCKCHTTCNVTMRILWPYRFPKSFLGTNRGQRTTF